MDDESRGGGGQDAAGQRRRRRRRHRSHRPGGEAQGSGGQQGGADPAASGPRAGGDVGPAVREPSRPVVPRESKEKPTPWQQQREAEERKRELDLAQSRQAEEKEPEPGAVCVGTPVFLADGVDGEEDFLADIDRPDWDPAARWLRAATVLTPVTRSRMIADAGDLFILKGDQVILSTSRGIELGLALEAPRWLTSREEIRNRIVRRCGYSDSRQTGRNETRAIEAFEMCRRLVSERSLDMKLLRVECPHGGGKIVFYFGAERRVDFRQLIRDLATQLHVRIEMRQIGVRDATRLIGGVGPCGEQVCCNRFLTRFAAVSIRMAKAQNLMLNPQKVSGVCGRLLCCLDYEYSQYRDMMDEAPRPGTPVTTKDGKAGRVRDVALLEGRCLVEMADGSTGTFPFADLSWARRGQDRQEGPAGQGGDEEREEPAEQAEDAVHEEPADQVGDAEQDGTVEGDGSVEGGADE